jgi:hypothetical protein
MTPLREVDPEGIHLIWTEIRPFIERAIDNHTTVEYVLGRIIDNDFQLWIGGDMEYVAVTRIEHFESIDTTAVLIMYLAGEGMSRWAKDALAQIESWAIQCGIDEIRITGRPGWERIFKGDGFRKTHTILAKPIGELQ